MEKLIAFIRKEFAHVMRDRKTLLILFGMPVMQVLIFGFALSNEVKNAGVLIWDQAQDEASQQIIGRLAASRNFELTASVHSLPEIERAFERNQGKIALVFPAGLNADLLHNKNGTVQILADASDPNVASTLSNYATAIMAEYQAELQGLQQASYRIDTQMRMLYNPQLKGAPNFVPGVIALVLMLVCVMMTAISIVREKENGTMEILLVSPFQPLLVIVAKAIPYLILSLINVSTILLLSVYVLDLPVQGSLLLFYAESTLFIITCLSIGIFISVKTATQQAAMLISLMGMMLPTILFSGFMFPIENMPLPLQIISNIVPAKWFYIIVKSIMIKGLGLASIWKESLILLGMSIFLLLLSLKNFKTRLA